MMETRNERREISSFKLMEWNDSERFEMKTNLNRSWKRNWLNQREENAENAQRTANKPNDYK